MSTEGRVPTGNTAQVTLPEGMDRAQFEKLFGTWQNQRVTAQTRDKAYRAALKEHLASTKEAFDVCLKKHGYSAKA